MIKKVEKQKEPEQAAVRRRMIIVGNEDTKRTTSAGRTYELPIWDEYKREE